MCGKKASVSTILSSRRYQFSPLGCLYGKQLHVSDYDGTDERHWIPGDGNIRWGELVHHVRKSGYKGIFMFETTKNRENNPVSPKQLANSFKIIEKEYVKYAEKND